MTLPRDLVAASSIPLVLSILSQGQSYGYAIIQKVKTVSEGEMLWADGMLYPILHRLEKRGHIQSSWGVADSGRKRKYYRLSKAGQLELSEQRANWRKVNSLLDKFAASGDKHV